MFRIRALSVCGVLLLGTAIAVAPMTAASASKHHKSTHHKAKKKGKSEKKESGSTPGSLKCPNKSLISSATGTTFTGPSANNGGTAACIYADAAGDDVNVVFETPNESRSKFVSSDPSAIGEPAQAVSGLGEAAFSTTTYGHAEVDVFESSTKGFAVTLDPAHGAAVTPADLTQVEAVAHALAAG